MSKLSTTQILIYARLLLKLGWRRVLVVLLTLLIAILLVIESVLSR